MPVPPSRRAGRSSDSGMTPLRPGCYTRSRGVRRGAEALEDPSEPFAEEGYLTRCRCAVGGCLICLGPIEDRVDQGSAHLVDRMPNTFRSANVSRLRSESHGGSRSLAATGVRLLDGTTVDVGWVQTPSLTPARSHDSDSGPRQRREAGSGLRVPAAVRQPLISAERARFSEPDRCSDRGLHERLRHHPGEGMDGPPTGAMSRHDNSDVHLAECRHGLVDDRLEQATS